MKAIKILLKVILGVFLFFSGFVALIYFMAENDIGTEQPKTAQQNQEKQNIESPSSQPAPKEKVNVTTASVIEKPTETQEVAEPPKPKKVVTRWESQQNTSEIDDSKSFYLYLESNESVKFGTNFSGKPAMLVINCVENKTALYIAFNSFMGIYGHKVTTRLDKEQAITSQWSSVTDSKGIWRNNPISFIKSMIGKSKLVVRVTPHGENPQTRTFDITGLDEEIKPLRKACHW